MAGKEREPLDRGPWGQGYSHVSLSALEGPSWPLQAVPRSMEAKNSTIQTTHLTQRPHQEVRPWGQRPALPHQASHAGKLGDLGWAIKLGRGMMTLTRILAPLWQQWRLWLGIQTPLQPWDRWILTVSIFWEEVRTSSSLATSSMESKDMPGC